MLEQPLSGRLDCRVPDTAEQRPVRTRSMYVR